MRFLFCFPESKKWLGRVQARDYFEAQGRNEAELAVGACAQALAEFEADPRVRTAVRAG